MCRCEINMLQTVKRLGLQSATYGLGSLLNKLLGFVLLPVYTRYLTPADYGFFPYWSLQAALALLSLN